MESTSPTLRTTLPGCREVVSSVLRNGAELYTEWGLLSHSIFRLLRPWNAAYVLSAITATPPNGWNTCGGLKVSMVSVF